jgi:hypothetical protein
MSKFVRATALCFFTLFAGTNSFAQSPLAPVQSTCPSGAQLPDLLTVEDQISPFGPRLEDVQLVTLENGRKAVVFAVRNLPVNGAFQYWNVRYSVSWQDSCGRLLPTGSSAVDGYLLNPNDFITSQAVAFDPRSARATLRVYFE